MKLKTLKDINENHLQQKGYEIIPECARKILKKEVIKWIKWKLSKNQDLKIEEIVWKDGKVTIGWKGNKDLFTVGFCNSLIDFHNITEKDLK